MVPSCLLFEKFCSILASFLAPKAREKVFQLAVLIYYLSLKFCPFINVESLRLGNLYTMIFKQKLYLIASIKCLLYLQSGDS